jgi:hypothetical protein
MEHPQAPRRMTELPASGQGASTAELRIRWR